MLPTFNTPVDEAIWKLGRDPKLAHKVLFAHRHMNETPEFHNDILDLFYSQSQFILVKAFRGGAKSTLAEEKLIIDALFERRQYSLIVGNSYERAAQRLMAVKWELENNEIIIELFGEQKGSTWNEDEIVLANGRKIQAFGARQSLRGAKHREWRPDQCLVDDLEDEEMVATEEARNKLKRWYTGALQPALTPTGNIIFVATPLHPQSLVEVLAAQSKYITRTFPITYIDNETGEEHATWPDRFPMKWVNDKRDEYIRDGNQIEWEQEYMCRAENVALKPFQASMIRIDATAPVWTPKFIMVDPARTVKEKSARTGYAVWSWIGSKLKVWEAYGGFYRPDEIINDIFKLDTEHSPVLIGVEADGLEEWLMQPLRAEMVKRGHSLPLLAVRAPKNKLAFITSLQPFFLAGEVSFVKPLPHLTSELLSFPTGRMDVPNALAYAMKMRVGQPVYEDFSLLHVDDGIELLRRSPCFLAVSSRSGMTTAVLIQYLDGAIRIFMDWVRDQPPLDALRGIYDEAVMFAGQAPKVVAPLEQFDKYVSTGLLPAARRNGIELSRGAALLNTEGNMKPYFQKQVRGMPAVLVSTKARWTLNALGGGYARGINSGGTLNDHPQDNQYKTLMEALESFIGWFNGISARDLDAADTRYGYTGDGRKFLSSLPTRR
jgi:hypothetical protein